jgi:hypothetical protein
MTVGASAANLHPHSHEDVKVVLNECRENEVNHIGPGRGQRRHHRLANASSDVHTPDYTPEIVTNALPYSDYSCLQNT